MNKLFKGIDIGSIKLTHTDGDDTADPMKRYRFFGTKVCNVLGLPEGQWTYPQNFHLDDAGGTNYFAGDIAATNLSITNHYMRGIQRLNGLLPKLLSSFLSYFFTNNLFP